MVLRLADRLSAARNACFVGRAQELSLFGDAVASGRLPFNLLHIQGPGGIGKTTLLRAFARLCEEAGVRLARVDARDLDATPAAFLAALGAPLGVHLSADGSELAALEGRLVLLIDTYELLTPLDDWLREVFLPALPDEALTVIAGRNPPRPAWRRDAGWRELIRVLPLGNLSPTEARSYLAGRSVPAEAHSTALDFTHGHPLALSLVAEVLRQQPEHRFDPSRAPDVIRVLLERFLSEIPGPLHRTAVEAAALLRVTTEPLLCAMLEVPDAHDIFEWLRDLSFIESGPLGIYPHDLARDAVSADLRWRDVERFAALHQRARDHYGRRLEQTHGLDQQRVLSDYVYLHRDNPVIKPFLDWAETGSAVPDALRDTDVPELIAMVARHEGDDAARTAARWMELRPDSVLVIRGAQKEPDGFLMSLPLHELTPGEHEIDPAVRAAWDWLRANAPLRAGEVATHFRFWMSRDAYQGVSATQSLLFLKIAQHYLATPRLAFTFFPVADRDFWAPFSAYIDLFEIPDVAYDAGRGRQHVFGHDWRAVPPAAWLDRLADRELDATPPDAATAPLAPSTGVGGPELTQPEFEEAVRQALKSYAKPLELRDSPLLDSGLVSRRTEPGATDLERVSALRELLRSAAHTLKETPRQARCYDALHHAYFQPASSQERAARQLHVSFSTFRRDVKTGVEHVAATLWMWERTEAAPHGVNTS